MGVAGQVLTYFDIRKSESIIRSARLDIDSQDHAKNIILHKNRVIGSTEGGAA